VLSGGPAYLVELSKGRGDVFWLCFVSCLFLDTPLRFLHFAAVTMTLPVANEMFKCRYRYHLFLTNITPGMLTSRL